MLDGKIERQQKIASRLQAARRAHAEEHAHDQAQVSRRYLDEVTFRHPLHSTQPTPSSTTCLAHVRETSFQQLATQPLQPLAPRALNTPAVPIHRFLVTHGFVR